MLQQSKADKLNVPMISVSRHAQFRAKQRFKLSSKKAAVSFICSMLQKAERVGVVVDKNGNSSLLYAHQKTGIYLTEDLTTVKTLYERKTPPDGIDKWSRCQNCSMVDYCLPQERKP